MLMKGRPSQGHDCSSLDTKLEVTWLVSVRSIKRSIALDDAFDFGSFHLLPL